MGRMTQLGPRPNAILLLMAVAAVAQCSRAAVGGSVPEGFANLAGTSGLPSYLRPTPTVFADAHGLRGGYVRTVASDLINHDFVFDVVFTFDGVGENREPELVVGIGHNSGEENWAAGTFGVRIHGPSGGSGVVKPVAGPRNQDDEIGKLGEGKGPHLLRLSKKGNMLTIAVSVGSDGTEVKPTFFRTIPDLNIAAPFLTKINSPLVFGGDAAVRAVRLTVDEKTPDVPKPPPATAPAAPSAVDAVPLFSLAGAAGLPSYLKASAASLADETGISNIGELRTVATDFINHDFTFDVVFRSKPRERSIFNIGIGESEPGPSVHSRVHGPGHGGWGTFAISGQGELDLGKWGDHPGPHLFRLEKRGKTFTMVVSVAFDGKTFEPTFSRTIPDLSASAPFLTKRNSQLFVAGGHEPTIEAVRLVVDGKPVSAGVEDAAQKPAAAVPSDDAPLFSLAGTSELPVYLKTSGSALATDTGLIAEEIRTVDSALVDKDFTFDFVFRFRDDGEQTILYVGIGALRREGNWIHESVYSRVHGPGHASFCTFSISGQPELNLGTLARNAGPHLFRLQKRGKTFTMAISSDFGGKFEPIAAKTIPDLKAVAPFLNSATAACSLPDRQASNPSDSGSTASLPTPENRSRQAEIPRANWTVQNISSA